MDDSAIIIKGEEILIEELAKMQNIEKFENKKISTLCHKDEVKGEYKNEFFNYIHIDNDGNIIDAYLENGEVNYYELTQNYNTLYKEFSRNIVTLVFLI